MVAIQTLKDKGTYQDKNIAVFEVTGDIYDTLTAFYSL